MSDTGRAQHKAHVFVASTDVEPRRRPKQERARLTVAAILEAAAKVIDDVGWAQASTNRIAERAGVSIGSLYQYFPNKEAILVGLFAKHHREVHAAVEDTMVALGDPRVPIQDVLRKLFDDLIALHRRDPVVARVLSTEVPLRPVADQQAARPGHDQEALMQLLSRRTDVRVNDLAAAARILEVTVEALTRWMMHEAPPTTDLQALVDESVAMLAGYLRSE